MQQLSDNPNLKPSLLPPEPMSETEIIALRTKYNNGNEFPLAFEEYLILAGNGGHTGVVYYDLDELFGYSRLS